MSEEPTRPDDEVAAYVLDGVDRQGIDALRAIAEYANARADYLEAREEARLDEEQLADDGEEIVDVEDAGSKGSIVEKRVPCGKSCSGCPHGPYKYRVWREGDDVKTEYLGSA